MTGKRFENRLDKSNVKFNTLNPVWDNEKETGLNVFEMIDELNKLSDENEELRKDNTRLRLKIESLNENFNRLFKLFNEVEDVDEDLMMEYMKIVGRTIDE